MKKVVICQSLDFKNEHHETMSSVHPNINYRIPPSMSLTTERAPTEMNGNGDTQYKCHFANCSREFKTQFSLQRHVLVHSGHKPFICVLCSSRFRQNGHLVSHVKKHHGNFLHCPKCKVITFPTVQSLQSHVKICQSRNKKNENIIINSPLSSSSSDLLLQSKDEAIDINCNCTICKFSGANVKFYSLKQFLEHLPSSTKKSSSTTTTIENYNNNHNNESAISHPSKNMNYYPMAVERFNQFGVPKETPSSFNEHRKSAITTTANFEGVSQKSQQQNSNTNPTFWLSSPTKNSYPERNEAAPNNNNSNNDTNVINVCHGCGIKIQSPYNFRRHVVRNMKQGVIKCTLCPSEFAYECGFQKHYRGHKENAGKFHRCEICDSYFTSLPSLRHHMKSIHLNVRNFVCPYLCGKQYAKASDLRKHLSVSHDDHSTSIANKNQSQHQNPDSSPYF